MSVKSKISKLEKREKENIIKLLYLNVILRVFVLFFVY